eukprot:570732-Rhodomonas_salina.1
MVGAYAAKGVVFRVGRDAVGPRCKRRCVSVGHRERGAAGMSSRDARQRTSRVCKEGEKARGESETRTRQHGAKSHRKSTGRRALQSGNAPRRKTTTRDSTRARLCMLARSCLRYCNRVCCEPAGEDERELRAQIVPKDADKVLAGDSQPIR